MLAPMAAIDTVNDSSAGLPAADSFTIESLTVDVYRAPIDRPVRTAFGTMVDRPAVVVTARSTGGVSGYGEVWCNFPSPAAEYRARLITTVLAPELLGKTWSGPQAVFDHLPETTRTPALQAGEPGPFSQSIAGIDIALWDMVARRAGEPLWRFLGGHGDGRVPAYASGIGPVDPLTQALDASAAGYRAFKLKVGFDEETDLANLAALRHELGPDAVIAVDANQAWTPDHAAHRSRALARYTPVWLEEPIRTDHDVAVWQHLADLSPIPLAAGENIRGQQTFDEAIGRRALAVIQPDVAKWGGISGCLPLAERIVAAGKRYCPHYLGGGIGLLASAHLLAAAGGDGAAGGGLQSQPATPGPGPTLSPTGRRPPRTQRRARTGYRTGRFGPRPADPLVDRRNSRVGAWLNPGRGCRRPRLGEVVSRSTRTLPDGPC